MDNGKTVVTVKAAHIKDVRNDTKKGNARREFLSWVLCIAAAVALALLIRYFLIEPVNVSGSSMEPTLISGETLVIEKISKQSKSIDYGDIVVVKTPSNKEPLIKRVVGKSGDVISISEGVLYRNGKAVEEDYIKEAILNDFEKVTVANDCLFIMGDNRNNSFDSRKIGSVDYKYVRGRALFVLFPLSKIHSLT